MDEGVRHSESVTLGSEAAASRPRFGLKGAHWLEMGAIPDRRDV